MLKQKSYTDQFNPNRLWPDLIPSVFPYYARGQDDRKNISNRLEEIRLIRNRLFHHEPIWKFRGAKTSEECIAELRRKFNDIFKAIGWISKHKRNCLREFGFVESSGRGIDYIFQGQAKFGRPAPDYSESNNFRVTVRLTGGKANLDFCRFVISSVANPSIVELLILNALFFRRNLTLE